MSVWLMWLALMIPNAGVWFHLLRGEWGEASVACTALAIIMLAGVYINSHGKTMKAEV